MCNKSENLQQAVKQITTLHYIQLTFFPGKPGYGSTRKVNQSGF